MCFCTGSFCHCVLQLDFIGVVYNIFIFNISSLFICVSFAFLPIKYTYSYVDEYMSRNVCLSF